ncbi:MAG: PAAR domain-containing protein [Chitinispirillaceae bacterium]|nr:PAAR domain-containing protein [Chitinispirillaceae bacterium]
MGKPAARLGDMTAHGGTITGPGMPTVLIGGMPAATMGDMHVCPMVTPAPAPVPHVGGPITLGSMGVLIGGKPAARMGDMAVCVGPPSSIILGCMTVLIGESSGGGGGGGGGGGAGAGGGSAAIGAITSASIAGQAPKESEIGGDVLDLSFIDKANLPVGGLRYVLKYPDGSKSGGVLGGAIKRSGVPEGDYGITLRGIVNAQWSAREADVGKPVTMKVDTIGVENGEKAVISIFVRDGNYTDHLLETMEAQVSGEKIEKQWTMQVDEKYLNICSVKESKKKFSRPFFFFRVTIGDLGEQSGILYLCDKMEISLVDDDGNAIANAGYSIALSSGEIKKGTLDSQGKARIDTFAPGKANVKVSL